MSKSEALHKLYEECISIDFTDTYELAKKAASEDEAEFILKVSDIILQQKQKKVIAEKRF